MGKQDLSLYLKKVFDLTLDEIDKISDYYDDFLFCGQLS